MIKAVCFDLWNTLVYCPAREKIDNIIKVLGLEGRVDYDGIIGYAEQTMFIDIGLTDREFFELVCKRYDVRCSGQQINDAVELWESRLDNARLFHETTDAIEKLGSKYRVGLISNIDSSGVKYMREAHRNLLEKFDVVLFSCEVGLAKPDERIFKLALEKLKTTPGETIMVGDSPRIDVEAPMKCGIHGLLIDRGDSYAGSVYKRIESLYEVEDYIKKIK